MALVRSHRDLKVYQTAMKAALRALELADRFPPEEKFGWRSQVHRCAPSPCANIAEAWRKRRYPRHFVSKLTDAEGEAGEAQVWMELAWQRGHISKEEFEDVFDQYEKLISQLVLFEQSNRSWHDKLLTILVLVPFALILMLL